MLMIYECVTLPKINSHMLSLVFIATGSILVNLLYFSHVFRFWVISSSVSLEVTLGIFQ